MKVIEFCKRGKAISDYKISEFVDEFLSNDKYDESIIPLVCTHLVINEIRARIAEGNLDHNNIRILVEGDDLNLDKDGRFSNWKVCQDVQGRILNRILFRKLASS